MGLKKACVALATAIIIAMFGWSANPASATPPVIEETYDFVNGEDWDRYGEWHEWPSEPSDFVFVAMQNDVEPELCPNDDCGLLAAATGPASFTTGDIGLYYINPPGFQAAYIESVEVEKWAYYKNDPLEDDDPRGVFGTVSSDTGDMDDAEYFTDQTVNGSPLVFDDGGPETQAFAFGLVAEENSSITDARASYLGKVTLRYGDDDAPILTEFSADEDGKWVNADPFDAVVEASDKGLGLTQVQVTAPLDPPDQYESAWGVFCQGTHASRCPDETPSGTKVTIDPSELPEGSNTLTATAWDVYDQRSDPLQIEIEVDKTKPLIDLGGSFISAPAMTLTGASYSLDVDATDGTISSPNSGVVSVKAWVDNVLVDSDSQACSPSNCGLGLDIDIDPDDYNNGGHQLKVSATDKVGNERVRTVDFEVDR